MELSSRRVHLLALMDPLILPKLCVECTLLEPSKLEAKSRPKLLQSRLGFLLSRFLVHLPPFLKDITMMPHENEIPLIVKGRDLSTPELRIMWEEASEEPSRPMTQSG